MVVEGDLPRMATTEGRACGIIRPMKRADTLATLSRHKPEMQRRFGVRSLALFGSCARGESRADSDIDLLVLLCQPFNYFQELRTIVDLLYPLQMESERLISAKPALVDEFEEGELQLYRNAKREGVSV